VTVEFWDAIGKGRQGWVTFTRVDTGEEFVFPVVDGVVRGRLPIEYAPATWKYMADLWRTGNNV
jgi:hypothetical protein